MHLRIKPFSEAVRRRYEHHGHFHDGDAGLDLFVVQEQTIAAGQTAYIPLQIACENRDGKPYLLLPRSSISQTPLRLSNSVGLIDSGYRGEITAAVDNIRDRSYTIKPGQRLFQLVSLDGSPIHFELTAELSPTTRGTGGFGSTGE